MQSARTYATLETKQEVKQFHNSKDREGKPKKEI